MCNCQTRIYWLEELLTSPRCRVRRPLHFLAKTSPSSVKYTGGSTVESSLSPAWAKEAVAALCPSVTSTRLCSRAQLSALMPHRRLILPGTEGEPSAWGKKLVSQLPVEEKDP